MRFLVCLTLVLPVVAAQADAVEKVTLAPGGGLLRNGAAYFIKGGGGQEHLEELVRRGGNSVRTWGEREIAATLKAAGPLGLTVCAGIWLEPECGWFSYRKPQDCDKQMERVRLIVRQHRDHPALLLWGLGNEMEDDGSNTAYWTQINRLAVMVHAEDPAHPTFTAVAGMTAAKADGLNKHAPDLDLVGINTYGALPGLREQLVKMGWTRPWAVTEFGPQGFWESPQTAWHAPVEQSSTEKAAMIRRSYEKGIAPGGVCVGGYVFFWGQKQEATATWFGVFTARGETTATADVLEEVWTGKPPANRAPVIHGIKADRENLVLKPGDKFGIEARADDPDGDPVEARWEVTDDAKHPGAEGRELPPVLLPDACEPHGFKVDIKAPAKPGIYRAFLFVTDGHGHAATGNVPFQVLP